MGTVAYEQIVAKYNKFELDDDNKDWKNWVRQNKGTIEFGLRINCEQQSGGQVWNNGDGGQFDDDEDDWDNNPGSNLAPGENIDGDDMDEDDEDAEYGKS
ncbi:hypothetical protein ACA910_016474 [Epithemia clementina (nom. ined.)]